MSLWTSFQTDYLHSTVNHILIMFSISTSILMVLIKQGVYFNEDFKEANIITKNFPRQAKIATVIE